ncbi:MAG TPA: efflux RND transporter permease subunit [Kofleriaceae bacterium]|nr:efflux RND transporter permease subunit [Kofleriaceae bacterium]
MMQITDVFIRRPVLAIAVNLVILVAGLRAIGSLNTRQYPRLDSSTITITTVYVGASSELVRGFVTMPLERVIAAANGIDYIESQSVRGLSTIHVRLKLNFNAAAALADINARVQQVRADLPPESQIPAIQIEPSEAAFAQMYLSFGSKLLAENQVTDYLIRVVQPRLSAIAGVQRAEILGGRTFALRVWLKPDRMAALNISPSQVRAALAANNYLAAAGQTKGQYIQVDITATTDLTTVDDFEKLVIRDRGGTLVRLRDIASVALGAEDYDIDVRFRGEKAVFMGVWVLPTASSVEVIRRVRAEMARVQHDLPTGMEGTIAFDATQYIEDAMHEVVHTLMDTIVIVMIVIFLFLGALRSVAIPVVAIPLSLVGGVFLMQVFGFTLNLLTLLAIVLSVGLVVDDAIVMVENIERHVRSGKSSFQAALDGARELVGPIISITITLAAVYVPIGFQGGLTGALFREFTFTLAGTVMISGIVALTLSPMMASRLIGGRKKSWFARKSDSAFEALRRGYTRALGATLRARPAVYAVWVALTLAVIPMYMFSQKELAPLEDQGVIFGSVDAPANSTIELVTTYTTEVNRIFKTTPEFAYSFQLSLPTGGFGGMLVKPWKDRARPIFPIEQEVNQKLTGVAGIRAPVFLPPALPSAGLFPIELVIASTADHAEIARYVDQLIVEATKSGQFAFPPIPDVRIDEQNVRLVVDRDKVAAMGQSMQQIGSDLAALLGGNFVNRFDFAGRAYKVIPQIERAARLTPDQLVQIHVSGPGNELVPLGAVATLHEGVQPRSLNRLQQLNAIKIQGVPTRSVDGALQVLESAAAKILPPGYVVDYTGESRQLRTEGGKFLPVMGLALLLIFLVLAAQFNSFRDPFVILAGSVPLAIFGALIFTFLKFSGPPGVHFRLTQGWTTTLNIYSEVGLVTLAGLVSKNGILIVQFANQLQLQGKTKLDAIYEAARIRLRPVLMVMIATVAGHFPLTLVSGPGAAARNSIGLVLVGGMTIGTIFTLFVLPSVYVLLARDHTKDRERLGLPKLAPP